MDFGEAVRAVKQGRRASRTGWNGRGLFIFLKPEAPAENMLAHLVMSTVTGVFVPWLASQTDILAEDWTLLP